MASIMIADSYKSKMEEYRKNGSDDEWFFVKLTDHFGQCEPFNAFEAIDSIVNYTLIEDEADLFYDHIQFLIYLGRKANTVESPQALKNAVAVLVEKATKFGDPQLSSVRALCAWFRLPFNK